MSRVRHVSRQLGKSGIAFVVAFALCLLFYFTGQNALLAITLLALIPLAPFVFFRTARYVLRHSLWSLRNRLFFVYFLFGVLPILLLFVLVGLGSWALMSELAIYLASSALDRRIDSVQGAAEAIRRVQPDSRQFAIPEIDKAFYRSLPDIKFFINDKNGRRRFPPGGEDIPIPSGWKDVNGLLFRKKHFYAWSHLADKGEEITVIAPLSDEMIANLVPHLGVIVLAERREDRPDSQDKNYVELPNGSRRGGHLPPPMNRLDIPVAYASRRLHFHVNRPDDAPHEGLLLVQSRPSAVFRTFFSGAEPLRGFLVDLVIGVAVLFLLVELVAIFIGISFSHRITRAVNQLYEGTRRVIKGDFAHRIPVRNHDQLGELAGSFNQMTGTLERLFIVEKEKERLQTEIEIAREVQNQLYPKEAPPDWGLKLTVRCDPARMVSGDYYDYQVLTPGKLAFSIGDVAGKGISAALLMATLHAALRAQLSQYQPTVETECSPVPQLFAAGLVSKLNKQIWEHTSPEKYATFFFAFFDESTRTLTYTNAGHISPLLVRRGEVTPLDSNGMVVGAFPFAKYDESCLIVEDGDLLVCYTDGITEPENAYGEEFGEERLIELVKKHAHEDDREIVRIVLDAVRSWTHSPELHDDMTLLLARQVTTA